MTDNLIPLGKMTVFYVPSQKLDDARFFNGQHTARAEIHQFLMDRFRAYTHTPTPVKGFWVDHEDSLHHDVMERFEVSFDNESDFDQIIGFMVEMCRTLNEESIYVTRGDHSFLVRAAD